VNVYTSSVVDIVCVSLFSGEQSDSLRCGRYFVCLYLVESRVNVYRLVNILCVSLCSGEQSDYLQCCRHF
jgi:hypothetical protein